MTKTHGTLPEAGAILCARFRLEQRIGRGGIGEVWRAADLERGGAEVACKILRADIKDPRAAVNFLKREVLVSRRLRHPSIVRVDAFYADAAAQFVTMEYVAGANLARMLAQRGEPFTPAGVEAWLGEVCAALDYAHAQGVLHRDIKPENVIVEAETAVPRLVDFGLADVALDHETVPERSEVRGTLAYMSPEVLLHGEAHDRSDQYSLAATVYEMLAGSQPFDAGEIVAQIAVKPPAPIPHVSEDVNRVLLRALAKSPERRFSTCGDFYRVFRAADRGHSSGVAWLPVGDVTDPSRETAVLGGFQIATRRTRLGKMLLETRVIDQEQLAEALMRHSAQGEKLGEALIALGYLTEETLAQTLAAQLQIQTVDDFALLDAELVEKAGLDNLREWCAVPLNRSAYGVVVAMADPLDMAALNALEQTFGEAIEPVVGTYSGVQDCLDRLA